jgi:hypothetical protein
MRCRQFETMPFLARQVRILESLDYPGGVDLLCYTPREFEEKQGEMGIVRVALQEGIPL